MPIIAEVQAFASSIFIYVFALYQVELAKIARLHELKSAECAKVRKLARSLLTARTDIEQHFLDSLNQAKDDLSYQL